jgi:hypothetical protein
MLSDDPTQHVAIMRRHENALDDDVVSDVRAVADGVRQEADVVAVRHTSHVFYLDATADVPVTVGAIISALGNPVNTARGVRRFL